MLEAFLTWTETHITPSRELTLVGLAAASFALIYVISALVSWFFSMGRAFANLARIQSAARDKSPGFRILVGKGRSQSAQKFVEASLEQHLKKFSFGAPFQLLSAGLLSGDLHAQERSARSRLKRSGADMILWAERNSRKPGGLKIYSLSRGGGISPDEAALEVQSFHGGRDKWSDDFSSGVAYKLAKCLQPALAHPEGFRPERMRDIADELLSLLNAKTAFSKPLKQELEGDFCANALHAASAEIDLGLVEKIIERRKTALESNELRGASVIQARLDLGRALLIKAEKAFDPVIVREGMSHLDAVIHSLRSDPSIRRAQQASDSIARGKNMLETRKRFSLNFGS